MDNRDIKSILEDAVEQEIPASGIDLLPAVRASLVPGRKFSVRQGETMNSTRSRRIQRLALAGLLIAAFMTVALVTPQGRAFAQTILQFFTRAESNSFPLQPSQVVTSPEDPSLPTAEPPALLMSVAEAEVQAGFDAVELPIVPEGFEYLGARLYGNAISLEYGVPGGGGTLILMQSQDGFVQSEWDKAPAEAITPVQINAFDGEFVQGTFVVRPGETSAIWNADAPVLRLRWMKDDIWFEMTKFGDVEPIEYLDRDGLIELAESLTTNPFPLDIKDAEAQAGFDVLEPSNLPIGMTFLGSSVDPVSKLASLSFGYSETDRRILIKQQPVDFSDTCDLCGLVGASASIESVQIGESTGEYALGVWELTDNGPVWRDDPYLTTIRWQKDGMAFELVFMGTEAGKEELLSTAESMK
jgi:hypothetical protein